MSMRGGGGGGSTLANLARRRQQLQQSRKALGMDVERGAPQAPTRTQPQPVPPPQAPAQPTQPQGGNDRAAMVAQVQQFIQQRRGQRRGEAAQPQRRPVEGISTRAGPDVRLTERIDQLGAAKRPVETQFYRLAGREGTPREIAIFRGRLELERQLKRPPTETELRNWMTRPASLGAVVNPAVEPAAQERVPLGSPTTPRGP